MPLPPLRNVDAIPVEHEGETYVCILDPEGYIHEQLALSAPAFYIATLLDGVNDVSDIQYAFYNQFGQLPATEQILEVVKALDNAGFLVSSHFRAIRNRVNEEFRRSPSRAAHMAGGSYPSDPQELRAFLKEQFLREGGPGAPPPAKGGRANGSVRCLVVPHIDFHRGGHSYAHGYLRLAQAGAPSVAFVFGVAHMAPPVPFVLTRKHFETPLGTVQTDVEIVQALESACAWDPYEYEVLHRTEHSIEFQAVMLAHLFGPDIRIVPILCGPLCGPEDEAGGIRPEAEVFLTRCREIAADPRRKACVIAGADLAHVGQRFGDDFDIDEGIVRSVERRDREDLAYVTALDPEGFYKSVMKDGNERRVCGINCIYAALRTVQGHAAPGELVQYDYAPDPAGGIVSFANIVFP
jgi:AmmeMemoRadiSam system protein B